MIACLIAVTPTLAQAPPSGTSPQFLAGFASEDITPEPGAAMPGSFGRRVGKGVRDPLFAVAGVFTDGATSVALVGVDALFVTRPTVQSARDAIAQSTPIPAANVLVGASHTHAGGPIAYCLGCEADPAYQDRVARAIAAAVTKAWEARRPVQAAVGTGREATIVFNRRFLMRDGRENTQTGKPGEPHAGEIVRAAGPVDASVGVLAVRAPGGAWAGVVAHFACHPTTIWSGECSADYIGELRKSLRETYGPDLPVVFLLGACGDLSPVDYLSATPLEVGTEHCGLMGRKLAAEAVRTIRGAEWRGDLTIAAAADAARVRIRPAPDVDRERPPYGNGSGEKRESIYVRERELVAEERARAPEFDAEVQAIRIGPLGIVTNGAEFFNGLGQRIKACSPHRSTWVVSLANEYIGYVPTANAFVAGGYEPRTACSSKLAIDAGQGIVEASIRALAKVATGEAKK